MLHNRYNALCPSAPAYVPVAHTVSPAPKERRTVYVGHVASDQVKDDIERRAAAIGPVRYVSGLKSGAHGNYFFIAMVRAADSQTLLYVIGSVRWINEVHPRDTMFTNVVVRPHTYAEWAQPKTNKNSSTQQQHQTSHVRVATD